MLVRSGLPRQLSSSDVSPLVPAAARDDEYCQKTVQDLHLGYCWCVRCLVSSCNACRQAADASPRN